MEYRLMDGVLVIETGEEIDHHATKTMISYIDRMIYLRNVQMLVFDMTKTQMMDSAGVGMMIGCYKEMHDRGGQIGVMHMQDSVKRVYHISGLEKILTDWQDGTEIQQLLTGKGGI